MVASKDAVASRAREALAAAQKRSGVSVPDPMQLRIEQALAAARQRSIAGATPWQADQGQAHMVQPTSEPSKELARRKAAEALKAAVSRSGSPETRRRNLEDRASKALSEALARQSGSTKSMDKDEGALGEFAVAEEPLGALGYGGHWVQESHAESETALGEQSFWPEETLFALSSSTWAGKDAAFGMPTDGSEAANRQTMWGVASCFVPWGEEASEEIRGAWTEIATTATSGASSRSAASAADSASVPDIDQDNCDDLEEAEELLASCWKQVTQI